METNVTGRPAKIQTICINKIGWFISLSNITRRNKGFHCSTDYAFTRAIKNMLFITYWLIHSIFLYANKCVKPLLNLSQVLHSMPWVFFIADTASILHTHPKYLCFLMKNLRIPEWQFSFNNSQTIRFSWQLFAQSYFLFTALTFSFSGAHLYIMSVPSLCLVISVCKALLSAFTSFSESMKTKISEVLT